MDMRNLGDRPLEIFKSLVEIYVDQGSPVGSKTLSERLQTSLSPATIRNIMVDLEEAGLLYSPHTSAGRVPTVKGLRFFVDGLLEQKELTPEERSQLEKHASRNNKNLDEIITETSHMLGDLSHCASLVLAPTIDHVRIKHIEFLPLSDGKGLVVLVSSEGSVENRIITLPEGITSSQLQSASRFINAHLNDCTLEESMKWIEKVLQQERHQLDALTQSLVQQGLALSVNGEDEGSLIVHGQSQLLQNIQTIEELDQIKNLFVTLERKETASKLIQSSLGADGVKIFIGAEHELFKKSGCSLIVSPYKNDMQQIIGLIGVIGPMHMNYRRIIPLVNYSAKLISKLLG